MELNKEKFEHAVNILREMFSLQNRLNIYTNGENWMLGKTNKGLPMDWMRYAAYEGVEAGESFNYKHWKDVNVIEFNKVKDRPNLKVELTDQMHFYMSHIITEEYQGNNCVLSNDTVAEVLAKLSLSKDSNITDDNLLDMLDYLTYLTLGVKYKKESIITVMTLFISIVNHIMDLDELYKLYKLKNVLNEFRQDHGYKEGTYVKNWLLDKESTPLEDNAVLEIYKNSSELQSKYPAPYDYLKERYESILNKKA